MTREAFRTDVIVSVTTSEAQSPMCVSGRLRDHTDRWALCGHLHARVRMGMRSGVLSPECTGFRSHGAFATPGGHPSPASMLGGPAAGRALLFTGYVPYQSTCAGQVAPASRMVAPNQVDNSGGNSGLALSIGPMPGAMPNTMSREAAAPLLRYCATICCTAALVLSLDIRTLRRRRAGAAGSRCC